MLVARCCALSLVPEELGDKEVVKVVVIQDGEQDAEEAVKDRLDTTDVRKQV